MAADTRVSHADDRVHKCNKLYRVTLADKSKCIVGLAGGAFDGLAFLDWLVGEDPQPPQRLLVGEADFTALVLNRHGLFEYDPWCRPDRILESFYAVGSGAKVALGALHMGASARRAVEIACKVDLYTAPPIVTMRLK